MTRPIASGGSAIRAVHDAIAAELEAGELLIADGHHRYETSLAYQQEVGPGGDGRLCADGPRLARGPRPDRLPHPSADLRARRRPGQAGGASANGLREVFDVEQVSTDELDPSGAEGVGVFGYIDPNGDTFRLRLRDTAHLDEAFADSSDSYRTLDAAILEELVLKGILGMTQDDIAAKRGIGYTPSIDEALAKLDAGDYQAAFLLRPTPVEQVRAVADEGETMPPKSTYFFPKLLTGIAFNPLS